MSGFSHRRAAGPIVLALLLTGCSLAGDVTPPAALATAQMAQPVATQPSAASTPSEVQPALLTPPSGPADLEAGRAIFAEKCAACHGATGMGDGELAANLQFPPAPLGQPDFARQATPSQWYTAVTIGRIERFMPPFASLNDGDRWAVAGYALSLSTTPDQLQQGEVLYEAECAICHGPDGPGVDLTVGRALVERSLQDLQETITQGLGADMPGFADRWSEDQRWAVAAFLQQRDLTLGTSQPEPVVPERSPLGSIRGTIRNGTAGGVVPAGLEVVLHGFDGEQELLTQTTLADGEGRFAFQGLESVSGRLYYASLDYQGVTFQSEAAHLLSDQDLDLPLTIYEPSSETGALFIERLHLLIDFPTPGVARVLQLWALTNPTDRIIADPNGVLRIQVPDGAVNVQFEELNPGERFTQTPSGYLDTAPVPPGVGAGDVAFGFDLLYQGRLDYEQIVDLPVEAVVVLVVPGGPALRGAGVQDMGLLDMGGVTMQAYSMEGLRPGETLAFRISGGTRAASALPGLAIGGSSLAAALILAGLWWYRAPSRRAAHEAGLARKPASQREKLLRDIARLDDEFEAGRLEEAEYRERRAALKQRALEALRDESD
jgi:mono/diheme cytochrome c family protein